MEQRSADDKELGRLEQLQRRARELANSDANAREALRASFNGFVRLVDDYQTEFQKRKQDLIRRTLATGHFIDPAIGRSDQRFRQRIVGLCLARQVREQRSASRLSKPLQQLDAKVALKAIDRQHQ